MSCPAEFLDLSASPQFRLWCLADPSFFIRFIHYLTECKLDWPVRTSPTTRSPASLLRLSTEAFRRVEFYRQWERAHVQALEAGITDIRFSPFHSHALDLLNLTEAEIRGMAGLPRS